MLGLKPSILGKAQGPGHHENAAAHHNLLHGVVESLVWPTNLFRQCSHDVRLFVPQRIGGCLSDFGRLARQWKSRLEYLSTGRDVLKAAGC